MENTSSNHQIQSKRNQESRNRKKILTVLLRYEYGRSDWGESTEKRWFHDPLFVLGYDVDFFWYDAWIKDQHGLRETLLRQIQVSQPQLIIFVPFKEQFSTSLLDEVRKIAPTLAWFGDDQWRFESFSSRLAPFFTHVVTTYPWVIPEYQRIGVTPLLSDWASDVPVRSLEPIKNDTEYKYDITFIGGANAVRRWYVKCLEKLGIKVDCFGSGWSNGRVTFTQMEDIFHQSRINLNLSNSVNSDMGFILGSPSNCIRWLISKKRSEQVKARNFVLPMSGGFQLGQYALGIERHFIIGTEIAVFGNIEECVRQVKYYLHRPEERIIMAQKAYDRTRREHSYVCRLKSLLDEVLS